MGLFICERCFCVENTALGRYWSKDSGELWSADNVGLALCSACAPPKFKSGCPASPHTFGAWHGEFARTWPPREDIERGIAYENGDVYHYMNRDVVLKMLCDKAEAATATATIRCAVH